MISKGLPCLVLGTCIAGCSKSPLISQTPVPPSDIPSFRLESQIDGSLRGIGAHDEILYSTGGHNYGFLVRNWDQPQTFASLSTVNSIDSDPSYLQAEGKSKPVSSFAFLDDEGTIREFLDRTAIRENIDGQERDLEPLRLRSGKYRYYRSGQDLFYRPVGSPEIKRLAAPPISALPLFKKDVFAMPVAKANSLVVTLAGPDQEAKEVSLSDSGRLIDFTIDGCFLVQAGSAYAIKTGATTTLLKANEGDLNEATPETIYQQNGRTYALGTGRQGSMRKSVSVACIWASDGSLRTLVSSCPALGSELSMRNVQTFLSGFAISESGTIAFQAVTDPADPKPEDLSSNLGRSTIFVLKPMR
ncbi:MAG: hypothetical protein JST12_01825 [Armatimonadetes bacterium]|nr:hypothetical protein [Armatimonadota bacterium]